MNDLSNPLTRIESYLAGIAGVLEAVPEPPLTRIEEYFKACYENLSGVAQTAAENLAAEYDPEGSYATGDYVSYEGTLYKALADSAEPAGEWDPEDWDAVRVMNEVSPLELEPLKYVLPEGCTDINTSVSRLGNIVFIMIDYAYPPEKTSYVNREPVLGVPAFDGLPIKTNFGFGVFNNYDPTATPPKYGDDGPAKSGTVLWQLTSNNTPVNKFVTSSTQSGIVKGRLVGAGLVHIPPRVPTPTEQEENNDNG